MTYVWNIKLVFQALGWTAYEVLCMWTKELKYWLQDMMKYKVWIGLMDCSIKTGGGAIFRPYMHVSVGVCVCKCVWVACVGRCVCEWRVLAGVCVSDVRRQVSVIVTCVCWQHCGSVLLCHNIRTHNIMSSPDMYFMSNLNY